MKKHSPSRPSAESASSGPEGPDAIRGNLKRRPETALSRKGPKDVDQLARIRLYKSMVLGIVPGGFLGLVGGFVLGHPFLGLLFGVLVAGFGPFLLSERMGESAQVLYAPSGRSTPPKRDYSRAESLDVRGHYDDAIAVYQEAVEEIPSDPEPYLRIARLLTDKVSDPEKAAIWLRRALHETELRGRWEMILVRELTELYRHRIGAPARAAPLLARMAEKYEGSAEGDWAREELAHVKRLMLEHAGDAESGGADSGP